MRHAEKRFSERRNAPVAAVRNARTEKIGRESAVNAGPQNISVVIAAEICNGAHPILNVVCQRCASTIQAETVHTGSARIFANVGISREDIHFGSFLSVDASHTERKKTEQRHSYPQFHKPSISLNCPRAPARSGHDFASGGAPKAGRQQSAFARFAS